MKKKFLVIGNPIEHSLSPKLHNKWFKTSAIDGVYEKKKLEEKDLKQIININNTNCIVLINVNLSHSVLWYII